MRLRPEQNCLRSHLWLWGKGEAREEQQAMPRFGSPRPFSRSSLVQAQGRGSLRLLSSQEEDFIRPSSREEAQQLWEAEKVKMRQVLDRQQKQMVEDSQWLRREERCLVSGPPLSLPRPRDAPQSVLHTFYSGT